MNLSKRINAAGRAAVWGLRTLLGGRKGSPFIFPTWGMSTLGVPSLINYLSYAEEGYGKNAIVHSCVREISRSAPSARLQVQRKMPNAQMEIWETNDLQRILDKPNQYQSQTEFIELYYTYLNIDGNAFIIRERKGRRTVSLWLPRPDRMRPVLSGKDLIGYVYVPENGEPEPWLVDEVIHIKEPNPSDPYDGLGRGISPLAAAAVEADVDNRATSFMKTFFDNAAVPFGLLKSKNILDDAEVRRIRSRIHDQYAGEKNWNEIMILDADADYQRMGLNLTEMAFTDLRAISETRICAVFKVPPILIGIKAGLDASTYSNYTQARRAMWEDKIIPDNNKLADKLSSALKDELGPDGVIAHDYSKVLALQEDRNSRFARANQGVNGGWITVNEGRREVGLAPVRGGDVFLRPLMSQATGTTPQGEPVKALVRVGEKKGSTQEWEQRSAAIAKRRDTVARAWELRFITAAKTQFAREEQGIEQALRKYKRKKAVQVQWGDVQRDVIGYIDGESGKEWAAEYRPLLTGLMNDEGGELADELGIVWTLDNPGVQVFISNYVLKFADKIGATTKEALRGLLAQAHEEQWTILQLITEIGRTYAGWSDFARAEMIARSETIRASNAAAAQGYLAAGYTEKQWWTAEDERTCPFCGEMHGKIVGMSESYARVGDQVNVMGADGETQVFHVDYEDVGYPPLHPNCRCTILAVVPE